MLRPRDRIRPPARPTGGTGLPGLANLSEDAFRDLVAPLRAAAVSGAAGLPESTEGTVPFLLVITRDLVPVARRRYTWRPPPRGR
ncbi:hypothetical protein ACSNOB_22550 [Micromonospora sp. URMC 106]|uniref:hypothetical protein n=1 Tax=Micromonospora sp. URMC 106 TaxID=3423408 RepID=UPI003F1A971F